MPNGGRARSTLVALVALLVALGGMVSTPRAEAGATLASTPVRAVSVTAGYSFSCALTSIGGARCWGVNSFGQLGDGTRRAHWRPADVVGLTSGVAQVAADTFTACAVTTVGGVKCWGDGRYGQLGDGSFGGSSDLPVDVVGLASGVRAVSVSSSNVCALTSAGEVKCWGAGGAVGDGSTDSSATPVDVIGLGSGVRAIATGNSFACALTAVGVSCWGYNGYGPLGTGDRTPHFAPVPVVGLGSDIASVSAGGMSACATSVTGHVSCWGRNDSGWLGVGSTQPYVLRPRPVPGLTGIVQVGGSVLSRCATDRRLARCWGDNDSGQLGDGTTTSRSTAAPVVGIPGQVAAVSVGEVHACALTRAGGVFCWGRATGGRVDGVVTGSLVPVRVLGLGA